MFFIIRILHFNNSVHVMKKKTLYHTNLISNNMNIEVYNKIEKDVIHILTYNKYIIKYVI